MASHSPCALHPYGGELGWVAGDPAHSGKGLGLATCTAVTARFIQAGYRRIYLRTDDFRLPAIKIYLKMGYQPLLHAPDMEARWKAVCEALKMPFTPAKR
jgi:mycothiol synthase